MQKCSSRSIHHQYFNKYRYIVWNSWLLKLLYGSGIVLWLVTVYGYIKYFFLPDSMWYIVLPCILLLTVYYVVSFGINLFYKRPDLVEHASIVAAFKATEQKPTVDIFLPICGEPLEILERTFVHVSALRYPHVSVYVLDDKGQQAAENLARTYGFHYSTRPNKGEFKKAGNLKFGFQQSKGEFIAIFDADFAPLPEFLEETIPYLVRDPKIGILQTPQHFEVHPEVHNRNRLQYGAAAVQEDFYRIIQVARNRLGGAICVGTNAVYRRSALDTIGGTAQIEHSEDVWTGVLLKNQGYNVEYKPYILAEGFCPDNFVSFFTQQYRWCKGSMSLLFSPVFWHMPVPRYTKMCYISGFLYYIHSVLIYVMPFFVFILLGFHYQSINIMNSIPFLPYIIFGMVILPMFRLHNHKIGINLSRYGAFAAYCMALIDTVKGKNMERTPSGNKTSKNRLFNMMYIGNTIYYLIYILMICLFMWAGRMPFLDYHYYSLLFWVVWNLGVIGTFLVCSGYDVYIKNPDNNAMLKRVRKDVAAHAQKLKLTKAHV